MLFFLSFYLFGLIAIELYWRNQMLNKQSQSNRLYPASSLEQAPEQLPYKYYANSFSHKFHRPSCPFGMCISKRHLVLFHFRKDAIEAHYAPCKYCLPPVWWSVHGVILPNKDNISTDKVIPEQHVENH